MSLSESAPQAFSKLHYHEEIGRLFSPALNRFNRLIKTYILFNALALIVAGSEIAFFFSSFAFLGQSSFLGFILALFFLTLFSFFVLKLYFQTKKPEAISALCEEYLNQCKEVIGYQEGIPEHHLALGAAAHRFVGALHEKEYHYYPPPEWLKSLTPTMEKFSAFCHWKDLHKIKEMLLLRSVEEHIKVVKCEPTNLEIHAALANAYVMLSRLYADPRKYEGYDEERWIPPERVSEAQHERFRQVAERAIEEFKILNDYAPDDPWVHIQLAYSYHDLQMPEEEIREYEIILRLRPNDNDTLFKLGMLLFQQGRNSEGLRIYEMLTKANDTKAENLIRFYGAFDTLSTID